MLRPRHAPVRARLRAMQSPHQTCPWMRRQPRFRKCSSRCPPHLRHPRRFFLSFRGILQRGFRYHPKEIAPEFREAPRTGMLVRTDEPERDRAASAASALAATETRQARRASALAAEIRMRLLPCRVSAEPPASASTEESVAAWPCPPGPLRGLLFQIHHLHPPRTTSAP